eukprot:8165-Heterococcus_DN1.PRE.6
MCGEVIELAYATAAARAVLRCCTTLGLAVVVIEGGKPFDNDLECDSHTYALDLNALSSSTRQWVQKAPLPVEC